MSIENVELDTGVRDMIREIVADIVEVDVESIGWNSHFWNELGADSLQGIEILSALERRFRITVEQGRLADMQDVQSTYHVVMDALKATGSHAP
jgi:acyl carrier protein